MSNRYASEIDLADVDSTHTRLVLMVGEGKKVLELGASSGYMTRMLQARGCHVTAVEYDPEAGAELALIAEKTVIGDLNDLSLLRGIPGRFDVVLAGDVFEHLVQPLEVVRAAVALLKPDGALVMSVPNVVHADLRLGLLQGRFDYRETGVLDATHLRWFTHKTLVGMLAEAGLVVVDLHRSEVRVFESEMAVPIDSVGPVVLSAVMRVPESETYQFVLTAVRDDGTPEMRERVLAHAPRPEPDFVALAAAEATPSGSSSAVQLAAAVQFAQLEAVALQRKSYLEEQARNGSDQRPPDPDQSGIAPVHDAGARGIGTHLINLGRLRRTRKG